MKRERRHELQHNALAEWVNGVLQTIKPHLNKILLGVLVVALVFLVVTWWTRRSAGRSARQPSGWPKGRAT